MLIYSLFICVYTGDIREYGTNLTHASVQVILQCMHNYKGLSGLHNTVVFQEGGELGLPVVVYCSVGEYW